MLIELCCADLKSAQMADAYGFVRIELNSALELGGLTPYAQVLKRVKESCKLKVIAMIRLRSGDFHYTESEIAIMKEQANELLSLGADGIAFGALNKDLSIDMETTKIFVELAHAHNAEFVFHRAYDCSIDKLEIEKLISLKADRLLTSGMAKNAVLGKETIKELHETYGSKIQILAGAGINQDNLKDIADFTGVKELHGSFSTAVMSPENNGVSYGSYMLADEEKVKKVAQIKAQYR